MSGLVLSDLHLFARRSEGEARFASLRGELGRLDVLVFNGDLFDFRWSTLPNVEATITAAGDWLAAVLSDFPDCQVHYVLGNHDCLSAFEPRLTTLAARHPRFAWHPHWLRVGSARFVHGDCAQQPMDAAGFRAYRARWQADHRQSWRVSAHAYAWADRLGVTRLVHEWQFPQRATVERILRFLDTECPGWRRETRDCYFGHTHLPFADYEFEGIRFHNTGSALRGARFNPCRFVADLGAI